MEITVKSTLNFWELLDSSWGGAKNVLEKVQEEGREEEAMQLIVEAFLDEVPTKRRLMISSGSNLMISWVSG